VTEEKDKLSGLTVGLSVSASEDLGVLGFAESHVRLMLGELARGLLVSGATILYGGRIDPEGYTDFLRNEIERYGGRRDSLIVCLPWSEHRKMALEQLREAQLDIGVSGRLVCLDHVGGEIPYDLERGEDPVEVEVDEVADSLTAARETLISMSSARILVGGRREGFAGRMPGVAEEAVLSISAGQPVFLAGGFGGVAADLVAALGLDPEGALAGSRADAPGEPTDVRVVPPAHWRVEENGLSENENHRLAVSHRPAEIASLILTGLRRLNDTVGTDDGLVAEGG
jgi:SLOG cluster2